MKITDAANHFNIANIITFANITCGLVALYLVTQSAFFTASIVAWCAGMLDIADGKVARRFNLSSEFGIQLDSFADFLSFVIMPAFFLFFGLSLETQGEKLLIGIILIWYVISGLRRLVNFNLKAVSKTELDRYFDGVPTPLGAILLWVLWLSFMGGLITNIWLIALIILLVALSLNSHIKIRHP
ncbi:MAG: CDP-alcohol phosphatidyltransferase family protein [Campylobacterales bacterium]|nr:CDP-alcohol phosphatidyltransferase family protein [Campylobacterales bacterium]